LQSNLAFRLMALEFRIRDLLRPPERVLREAEIRPGMFVLDFGCGPGGFSLAAARMVAPEGRVYALDMHPLAVRSVRSAAQRQGLSNIQAIQGCDVVGLHEESIDIALLYDVLHDFPEPESVLSGLHRVLKPKGRLSVKDHHIRGNALLAAVTFGGFFRHVDCGRYACRFERSNVSGAVT